MGTKSAFKGKLAGKKVFFSGKFEYGQKPRLEQLATGQGAKIVDDLSADVDMVLSAASPLAATVQKKIDALNKRGASIHVMDAAAFHAMALPTAEDIAALLRDGKNDVLNQLIGMGHHYYSVQKAGPQIILSGENFEGVSVDGLGLDEVEFAACRFVGATLAKSQLYHAGGCDFSNCRAENVFFGDISHATFAGADFNGVTFGGAFSAADFSHSQLQRTSFHSVSYHRSTRRVPFVDGAVFQHTRMQGAQFDEVALKMPDFTGADITGGAFKSCKIEAGIFKAAKMSGASLLDCTLKGADFSGADLRGANFSRSDLKGANFNGADLADCNFYDASISGADFSRARNYNPDGGSVGTVGPALKELDGIFKKAKRIRVSFRLESATNPEGDEVSLDTTSLQYGWGARTTRGITSPNIGSWGQNKNMNCSDALLQAAGLLGKCKVRFETVDVSSTKSPIGGKELRDLVIRGLEEAFAQSPPPTEELLALTDAYRAKDREASAAAREAREKARAQAEKTRAAETKKVEKKIEKAVGGKVKDIATFLTALGLRIEDVKIDKATKMLKKVGFQLFNDVTDTFMSGVVKSQTDPDLVYACRISSDGKYACCTQNLNICGGLRGSICKHLLVLIIGLVKAEKLDPTTIDTWVAKSNQQKAELDKEVMGEIFIKYKGAEAGEVDWRPTETLPEDYYAL
jgi:uncharacterized protein YjbI with pentapeptide repeats